MKFIFAYLAAIVFVNLGFSYLPMLNTPLGTVPMMAFFVGTIFVLRDYAQRTVGKAILPTMIVGCVLSWVFGDPTIVVASVAAFALSEFADYVVFTVTKKPFHKRVFISSLVAVPIDSIVFLAIIGVINPAAMLAMSMSKFVASFIIWSVYEVRGRLVRI
ncbi:putative vitamin uptake transporter [Hafnia phage yong3]|nr:putative vitamin uptake transporter [Hafnia phage yong3]